MKNVLLLCLSTMNIKARENKYSYELEDGSRDNLLTGFLTNEAPAKSVISRLYHNNGQRLDRIVVICSEATKNPMIAVEKQNSVEPELVKRIRELNGTLTEMTHFQYYKAAVNDYAETVDLQYKSESIEFCEISVPDDTKAKDISEAAVIAANQITDMGDEVNLYIDYNGGQRYMAFMILSIANLMKIRHVDIKQVLTMNWNGSDSPTPIDNNKSVFDSINLIAGINEYINYGRIRSLREYFVPSKNETILKLLDDMEEFSNNLQLCRTTYIMNTKERLFYELDNQSEFLKNQEKDIYEVLFSYVLRDILAGYNNLLHGELPEMIKWCVERDYIQQALTFCSEQMPRYFWDKGIFRPTEAEEKEYNIFLNRVFGKSGKQIKSLQVDYRSSVNQENVVDEKKSGYAYNWMIKYLQFSCKKRNKSRSDVPTEYENIMSLFTKNKLFLIAPPGGKDWSNRIWKMIQLNSVGKVMGLKDNRLYEKDEKTGREKIKKEIYTYVACRIWQFQNEKRVYNDGSTDEQKLGWVLTVYFLLKEQRNKTNHADDSNDEALWTYQELYEVIRNYVDFLSEYKAYEGQTESEQECMAHKMRLN